MATTTRPAWVLVPLALVVGGAATLLRARKAPISFDAVRAIPSGAAVVVTVDLSRLRGGPLAELVRSPRGDLGACGVDPLARGTTLAVGMPGEGDEFGVAVAGPFDARELAACASAAIQGRKGWPTTRREQGFEVVADATARGAGVVAVRDGGPLLFGGAAYVRRMIDAATSPPAALDPRHAALRVEIDAAAPVVGTLVRGEADEGLRGLAVSAAVGERVEVRAFARCDRDETCAALGNLAKNAKDELGPLGRLTWLGAALARTSLDARGPTLRARVDLSVLEAREAAAAALDR